MIGGRVGKLLGKVDLRYSYTVYEEDGVYTVTSERLRGQRYECRCYREGAETGLADYFVNVGGEWIPVEAKLSVLASSETRLQKQVNRYIAIDSFSPTVGARVGESFAASSSPLCLVADQAGIYTTSNGEFQGCAFGKPAWRREELDHPSVTALRQWIEDANRVAARPPRVT
jgi:hypothetical protein